MRELVVEVLAQSAGLDDGGRRRDRRRPVQYDVLERDVPGLYALVPKDSSHDFTREARPETVASFERGEISSMTCNPQT